MVQVCPFCKRSVSEEDAVCPHCGNNVSIENNWITEKKQYYKRQNKVYVLGFSLLISAVIYWLLQWRGIFSPNWVTGGLFAAVWVAGFLIYCVYMRKGDSNFAWIH